ncbi:MAG: transposase [Gammaproteobacteria bacterium]|nr:transposase [Gammaproteobacteria bacterium]
MPKPRSAQIAIEETPFYHLVSRCVRRAFLCGCTETYNFEHRRGWILERLSLLTQMFAIDVAAFALMSNHYHLVVRVDSERAKLWSANEVIQHWQMIFRLPVLVEQYLLSAPQSAAELQAVEKIIETWRCRLSDISWFMRCLNEHIARQANLEDHCTGRFWEGRFKSQALLDEKALLTAMAYVDLNPIRAQMADTPESSDYTSIQQRLGQAIHSAFYGQLLPFAGIAHQDNGKTHIPYHLIDYIELVDWTGRQMRPHKKGNISERQPPILARLGLSPACWLHNCQQLENDFHLVIGPLAAVQQFCQKIGQRWLHGQSACRRSFG